jgi:nucleoside-diphosphate-sugar epimerase
MKIAITGANGFVGSTLLYFLLKTSNFHISAYSNRTLDFSDKLDFASSRYKVVLCDLRDPQIYHQLVTNDVVIHLSQEDLWSTTNTKQCFISNSLPTAHLFKACASNDARPYIILASSYNITRSNTSSPPSLWSLHKFFSEQYLLFYKNNYGGRIAILRIANVYGKPINVQKHFNSSINRICRSAHQGTIKLYANANCNRAFINVNDLASSIFQLIIQQPLSSDIFYAYEHELITYSQISHALKHYFIDQYSNLEIHMDPTPLSLLEMQEDTMQFPSLFTETGVQPDHRLLNYLKEQSFCKYAET